MRFTPAICALLLSGCFPTRSTELACVEDVDCVAFAGTTCSPEGYCLPEQDVAGPDAAPQPDSPPAEAGCEDEWTSRPTIYDPCSFASAPAITISGGTFNTTTGTWTGASTTETGRLEAVLGGQQTRILIVEGFTLSGGTLRVEGDYPLLILSFGDISINGIVDASSNLADAADLTKRGAGANSSICQPATAGLDDDEGGSGGGGGGFGSKGGDSGDGGNEDVAQGRPGGAAVTTPPTLAGGCPGAAGGKSDGNRTPAAGGAGGGAVYFASMTRVTVGGTIDVGGAAGPGAKNGSNQRRGGGAGGGSGGFIGLEAPVVDVTGTLAANGGGGGAGCDENNANDGVDSTITKAAATGGAGSNNNGSSGGNGGFDATPATNAADFQNDDGGGGGGGGGFGFVVLKGAGARTGTITPVAR